MKTVTIMIMFICTINLFAADVNHAEAHSETSLKSVSNIEKELIGIKSNVASHDYETDRLDIKMDVNDVPRSNDNGITWSF